MLYLTLFRPPPKREVATLPARVPAMNCNPFTNCAVDTSVFVPFASSTKKVDDTIESDPRNLDQSTLKSAVSSGSFSGHL
jgi:hypothetical protein